MLLGIHYPKTNYRSSSARYWVGRLCKWCSDLENGGQRRPRGHRMRRNGEVDAVRSLVRRSYHRVTGPRVQKFRDRDAGRLCRHCPIVDHEPHGYNGGLRTYRRSRLNRNKYSTCKTCADEGARRSPPPAAGEMLRGISMCTTEASPLITVHTSCLLGVSRV